MTTRTMTGRGIHALAGLLFAALALSACETDDAPVASAPDFEACLNQDAPVERVMHHCRLVLESETVSMAERTTALTRMGYGHLVQGEHREAVGTFHEALALKPDLKGAHLGLGWTQLRLQDLDAAAKAFDQAIALDANLYSANEGRGIVRLVNQDYALAITDFDKVLAANPRSARARRNRGDAYFALGQHELALADYDAVISMARIAQPELFLTRSQILRAMGHPADPVADWTAALDRKGPDQIGAWQRHMQAGGLYSGPINGEMSLDTREALAACISDKNCRSLRPGRK